MFYRYRENDGEEQDDGNDNSSDNGSDFFLVNPLYARMFF